VGGAVLLRVGIGLSALPGLFNSDLGIIAMSSNIPESDPDLTAMEKDEFSNAMTCTYSSTASCSSVRTVTPILHRKSLLTRPLSGFRTIPTSLGGTCAHV
jgi:hypothetical protein